MARMIPLHISVTTDSAAERKLFDELERACPSDWIVLHSLDLAQRGTGPLGEADFVLIAPGFGVMAIEAKTYLSRTADGEWLTHPLGPPKERGPFQQAGIAMHRIKDWLRTHNLPDALLTCAVIVPDMEVTVGRDQIEWSTWQLIDRPRYMSKSLERLLIDVFDAQRAELEHPPTPLTVGNAERIVRVLRGEVECYISPKARIAQQLDEVRKYTEEQFRVLDQMGDNKRLLIDGLAGTGKTLLAIEAARRAVGEGRRVLFVCYNRLLGEWLRAETAALGDECLTTTIHEFMQEVGEAPRQLPQPAAGRAPGGGTRRGAGRVRGVRLDLQAQGTRAAAIVVTDVDALGGEGRWSGVEDLRPTGEAGSIEGSCSHEIHSVPIAAAYAAAIAS